MYTRIQLEYIMKVILGESYYNTLQDRDKSIRNAFRLAIYFMWGDKVAITPDEERVLREAYNDMKINGRFRFGEE